MEEEVLEVTNDIQMIMDELSEDEAVAILQVCGDRDGRPLKRVTSAWMFYLGANLNHDGVTIPKPALEMGPKPERIRNRIKARAREPVSQAVE